jgi:hypothetical protein
MSSDCYNNKIHRLVDLLEAYNHIFGDDEPQRALHHLLKLGLPELCFDVYKSFGLGNAQSVREMLMESKRIVEQSDGKDWITPMYGEKYDLK